MDVKFKFVPSKINDNPIINKSIFFMHIPKSGGTTIDRIFAKLSVILKNFDFERFKYNLDLKKKLLLSDNNYLKPKFYSGHLDYNFCDNLNNIFKCSLVREPISRVVSHYKFMVYKLKRTPENYTFKDFINEEITKNRDNIITRHFSGLLGQKKLITRKDFKSACINLNNFDSIYTFDKWDNFLSDLLSNFGLPSILYSNFQQHTYTFSFIPQDNHIQVIRKHFKYDLELYSKILLLKNNFEFKKNDIYNKNICIVSPFLKTKDSLYTEEEVKRLFESKNEK